MDRNVQGDRVMKTLVPLSVLLLLLGCTSRGPQNMSQIRPGLSGSQVTAIMGRPTTTLTDQTGLTLWRWHRMEAGLLTVREVVFDGDQVVLPPSSAIFEAHDQRPGPVTDPEALQSHVERKRRETYLRLHPNTPEPVARAIRTGNVLVGMSTLEVEASVGKPETVQTHADSPASQWLFGRTQLAFEEGVVVAIRHLP